VTRRARVFHGWWVVLVAFVCHAVNTGCIFYAWGVFVVPLAETFGGRGPVANGFAILQLAVASYGLIVGRAVDRLGARPVQALGAVVLSAGYLAVSHVDSLAGLYLCLGGPLALGSTCIGALPNNSAVARWFVHRRGRALGLATAGISAGGMVFVPLAQHLILHRGWRGAFATLAVVVPAVVLPPVLLLMRRDPGDLGLLPDGLSPATTDREALDAVEREIERSVPPGVAIRQPSFWLLAAAFSLTMAGLAATLLYQVPLLIDRGLDERHASFVLGATAAMGVLGKLGFGALLDRFDQRRVAAVCFLLQAAGVLLLWRGPQTPLVLGAYVVLYGYAMGGNATLLASLTGAVFGRLHYGSIAGRMSPFVVAAQAIGVPATGYLRDHTGSYGPAFATVIAASVVAAGIVLRVRMPAALPARAPLHT
jgi:MFS family permease